MVPAAGASAVGDGFGFGCVRRTEFGYRCFADPLTPHLNGFRFGRMPVVADPQGGDCFVGAPYSDWRLDM